MPQFIAQLGNTPDLSLLELQAVYPDLNPTLLQDQTVILDGPDFSPQEAIGRLGGIVKIAEVFKVFDQPNPSNLAELIIQYLASTYKKSGKIHFALGEIGRDHLPTLEAVNIKNELKNQGIPSRYVEGARSGLSAAVLLHQKVREILIIQTQNQTYLAATQAVQDINEWTNRDRNKPYFDRKKGMLPPKVARMMVNLALGSDDPKSATLLDPFCGSGTVLLEAVMLGCSVIGSDLDKDAAEGTRENLSWISHEYNLKPNYQVFHKDATQLSLQNKVTHLVTEPFLGKPTPSDKHLENMFKGLEKLYLGAFKQFTKLLERNAKICAVFPEAVNSETKRRFTLEKLIDKLQNLGYTTNSESVLYHRPGAIVQRSIQQFKFTGK